LGGKGAPGGRGFWGEREHGGKGESEGEGESGGVAEKGEHFPQESKSTGPFKLSVVSWQVGPAHFKSQGRLTLSTRN
jgi:hypothetical protein